MPASYSSSNVTYSANDSELKRKLNVVFNVRELKAELPRLSAAKAEYLYVRDTKA